MPYKKFELSGIGEVTVYKRRGSRSLRLSVTGNGVIRVSIPWWTSYQTGLDFTLSRRAWIDAQARPLPPLLSEGMAVGKTRHLHFMPDTTVAGIKTSVRSNVVRVTYNQSYTWKDTRVQQAATSACWRALKAETISLIAPRLNLLAEQHGYAYRSLRVKRLRSRWGSCDSRQNIVLNLFLPQLPWACIDYVLLHELTHTQYLNHGPAFWSAMERVLPGARRYRKQLHTYQPTLLVARP